ncbi:MAG TPA: (2Fe-2S)-binding protein [Streptomyces sp.]
MMTSFPVPPERDPARPLDAPAVRITLDGRPLTGVAGQTIAGIALANGRSAWRRTSRTGRPRGLFCGIGVCFDCLVVVNGARDVRACRRRAHDGDEVAVQHDPLPTRHEASGATDGHGGTGGQGDA